MPGLEQPEVALNVSDILNLCPSDAFEPHLKAQK